MKNIQRELAEQIASGEIVTDRQNKTKKRGRNKDRRGMKTEEKKTRKQKKRTRKIK